MGVFVFNRNLDGTYTDDGPYRIGAMFLIADTLAVGVVFSM